MKLCKRCKINKNRDCFHNDKLRKDLLYPYCKDCRREINGSKKMIHRVIGEFKGMMIVDDERYPYILTPKGSFRAHRYIMQDFIGRNLERGEVVHHKDGNKKNWNLENLVLMKDKRHRVMEGHNNMGYSPTVTCNTCGKKRTYSNHLINKGKIVPSRYQCSKCYYKSGGAYARTQLLKDIKESL